MCLVPLVRFPKAANLLVGVWVVPVPSIHSLGSGMLFFGVKMPMDVLAKKPTLATREIKHKVSHDLSYSFHLRPVASICSRSQHQAQNS